MNHWKSNRCFYIVKCILKATKFELFDYHQHLKITPDRHLKFLLTQACSSFDVGYTGACSTPDNPYFAYYIANKIEKSTSVVTGK